MNTYYRLCLIVLFAVFTTACHTLPEPRVEEPEAEWLDDEAYFLPRIDFIDQQATWRYSAKVSISSPEVREQANLVWEYRDQANEVRLFGPLGVGAIKLEFDEYGVVLSDNKGLLHRGDSAEQLLTQIVGWPIPIDALSSWIFVMPATQSSFRYQLNEDNRIKRLEQLGWSIEYSAYKYYGDQLMPRKIVATRTLPIGSDDQGNKQVVVKLITKSWSQ